MAVRHSEYPQQPGDFFATPAWVTEALLSIESFTSPVLVPGCGDGGVSDVVAMHYACIARDLRDGYDFLSDTGSYAAIIANPPWSNGAADRFVRHALARTESMSGAVAMLLPMTWSTAKRRHDIFRGSPIFAAKYELTTRIRWKNLEQIAAPASNHAWHLWDWRHQGRPVLGWLPRS